MKKIFIFMMFLLLGIVGVNGVLTDNNIGYWSLDNTLIDSSINENTLSNDGGATYTTNGKINGAYITSSNKFLTLTSNDFQSKNKLSFGMWVKPNTGATANFGALTDFDNQNANRFGFYDQSGTKYIVYSNGNSGQYATYSHIFVTNTWYYVLLVYDGTQSSDANKLKLYINNVQKTLFFNTAVPTSMSTNIDTLKLGSSQTFFFDGTIDEVGIWDRALSTIEGTELYNSGNGTNPYDITFQEIQSNIKPYYNTSDITININTTINTNMSYVLDGEYHFINPTKEINGVEYELEKSSLGDFFDNETINQFCIEKGYNTAKNYEYQIAVYSIDRVRYSVGNWNIYEKTNKKITEITCNNNICNDCNSTTLNLNSLSEGAHSILFVSEDENGQVNTTVNFTIDTTLPTINNNIPSEINNYQFNGSWFSCSDTNLVSCNISINSQNIENGTNITLSNNGNLSYTITAIDLANNTKTESGVLLVNPFNYIYFALSNGTKINSFEIDNVTTNNYYQFKTYDFGLGTHVITFSKIGFLTQNFNFTLTTNSTLNLTKTVSPAKIVIKIYDRDKMTLITSNSSISLVATNGVIGSTTTGLFNISNINFLNEQYQVIVSNPLYQTEIVYFNFDNRDILEVNVYLLNSSLTNLGYVVMSVVADTGQLISGATCQALEWKPGLSSYISVAQGLTNTNGQTNLNIELNDKLYKFNCYKDSVSVTTNSQIISVTGTIIPIVLSVSTVAPVNIFQNIIFSLTNTTINSTHERFIYTYNDQKGLVSEGCLKIYQKQGTKLTLLQQSCVPSNTAQPQLIQNLNVTYPIKVIGTIKYNGLELSLIERIIYPEQDITKSLQEYGLDIILPLLFILIGIAFGLLVTPQNIYISIITTIIGVWLSVVIVPSIISSSIAIFVTFICALMLWGGFKPK